MKKKIDPHLLGEIESGNNYSKVNSEGGGFGALD